MEYRPLNVVGSYAVYGTHEGNQYGTGKLFHLYRPLLIDANGIQSWASINVTNNILTLTADMTFLVNAAYPIIIDPTFGYTSIGASVVNRYSNEIAAGKFTCSETGTATKISVYMAKTAGGTTEAKGIIYKNSDSSLVIASAEVSGIGNTASWVNFTVSQSVSAQTYNIGCFVDDNFNVYRDNVWDASQNLYKSTSGTYPTVPDPAAFTSIYNEKMSVFVTYTTGGGSKNLYFNLTAVPAITASLRNWKTLFKGLSQAPGSITDLAFGRAFIRSFSNIPTSPSGISALRALMFPFETVPTYVMDSSFGLGKIAEVTATITPAIVSSLTSNKALAFALSGAPKFIVDLTFAIESGVTFVLSIAPGFTTNINAGKELFRALSGAPTFITDITKEIELSFIEYILPETIHIITNLNTILQAAANLEITFALAALAFILAITALSMIFLKKKD